MAHAWWIRSATAQPPATLSNGVKFYRRADMPRMPRLVVPGLPHHVTQRGARRQRTFFDSGDYAGYLDLLLHAKQSASVDIWAYCLMPNHVHFVAVPSREDGLRKLFAELHRRYTARINERHGWRGHLWQERFFSCVMDERHLLAAVRYVERNPVRAHLCARADEWAWSSATAHLNGIDDPIIDDIPMRELIDDWATYLRGQESDKMIGALRAHSRTGRPLGDEAFVRKLEVATGRRLRKRAAGRPRRTGIKPASNK